MARMKRVPVDKLGEPVAPPNVGDSEAETCRCPELDYDEWHDAESDWSDIAFIRIHRTAVLGVPLGYGAVRNDAEREAERAGATIVPDAMVLMGEGKFRRPVLVEVEGPQDARGIERPGGFAYTQIHRAPYGELGKRMEETVAAARRRYGRNPDDTWVWYLTCRICSAARNFETLFVARYAGQSRR